MTPRILLCTVGETPQIVTETIDALLDRDPPWRPDRIEIVSTGKGVRSIVGMWPAFFGALATLFPDGSPPLAFYAPCTDGRSVAVCPWPGRDAPPPAIDEDVWCHALNDVLTIEQSNAMGDAIKDRIAAARSDSESELHVSIAGGRKTMSAQALLTLALLGRAQDEASHVLVSPEEFEGNRKFWHRRQPGPIHSAKEQAEAFRNKTDLPPPTFDPATAKVTLVPAVIPFVSQGTFDADSLVKLSFKELSDQVDFARRVRLRPELILADTEGMTLSRQVTICGETKEFLALPYLLLRILAQAAKERWPAGGMQGVLTMESIIGAPGGDRTYFERAMHNFRQGADFLRSDTENTIQTVLREIHAWRTSGPNLLLKDGKLNSLAAKKISASKKPVKDVVNNFLSGMRMKDLRDELVAKFGPFAPEAILRIGRGSEGTYIGLAVPPERITLP